MDPFNNPSNPFPNCPNGLPPFPNMLRLAFQQLQAAHEEAIQHATAARQTLVDELKAKNEEIAALKDRVRELEEQIAMGQDGRGEL